MERARAYSAPTMQRQPTPPIASPAEERLSSPCTMEIWSYEGSSSASENEKVTIHVHDECNGITRNFICKKDVLLTHMKYFKSYLAQDLEISVHCDVSIFKWLMEYVHDDKKPASDPTIAVSILISSDFLQMTNLVNESLQYVASHIQEIVKLPIDLDCISKSLISRLAALYTYDELDRVKDRKDRIVGALFLHKLLELLRTRDADGEPCNVLFRCVLCGKLFTEKQKSWAVCPKTSPFITFNGDSVSAHVVDNNWDVNAYLSVQRAKRLSWKEIFWRTWALVNDDICKVCGRHFVIAEMGHCSFHLSLPTFKSGNAVGVFPCCDTPVQRFEGGTVRPGGCYTRDHTLSISKNEEFIKSVIARHSDLLIPWNNNTQSTCNTLYAPVQDTGSDVDSDASSTSSGETFGPDWRRRSRWSLNTTHPVVFTEGDGLRKSLQQTNTSFPSTLRSQSSNVLPNSSSSNIQAGSSQLSSQPSDGTIFGMNACLGILGCSDKYNNIDKQDKHERQDSDPPKSSKVTVPTASMQSRKRRKKKSSNRCSEHVPSSHASDWWMRLGPKARSTCLLDSQRESDSRRMQNLIAVLEKRRVDSDTDKEILKKHQPEPATSKPQKKSLSKRGSGLSRPGSSR
eukprot:TRINITY_DN33886_c0_g1_i1.p1 TRINITY_DN33886_c0_g1~~TRINITY_DN33886_c0_g1_i1.p1  ORF type:complete len:709 (+),score=104.94 TRINITY_DN33886_c0_g1_i1:248-2128(+)